jgi:RNA polymerase sigma-70 factor (ECF subfamily)
VAKNKARNHVQRNAVFERKIFPELKSRASRFQETEIDLSGRNIIDSQLQTMFAVCHPAIPAEAQIGLALRILCGFSIAEIAAAFQSNKEAVNKRLFRAKEKLRELKISIEFPSAAEVESRLAAVLATIYLLFNEGYYSTGNDRVLRKELCLEAMRLCNMLAENEGTCRPQVNALMALMCFHASRFEARLDMNGGIILYADQDQAQWNAGLIAKGFQFLMRAASGKQLSRYHLEAAIASWNTQHADSKEKWTNILKLYDQLLAVEYSPAAALNRLYALSQVHGKQAAITEAETLEHPRDHFYFSLLGELYSGVNNTKAKLSFQKALTLSKATNVRKVIEMKLSRL